MVEEDCGRATARTAILRRFCPGMELKLVTDIEVEPGAIVVGFIGLDG